MKRSGHGDGPVSIRDLPRARARYLTSSSPAPEAPVVTLTAEELVALVTDAVNRALDARDGRQS